MSTLTILNKKTEHKQASPAMFRLEVLFRNGNSTISYYKTRDAMEQAHQDFIKRTDVSTVKKK